MCITSVENNDSKRYESIDLLRLISCIGVVILHCTDNIIIQFSEEKWISELCSPVFLNSLFRFAVPCFLMISGAFIIQNQNNEDWKAFYNKTFQKLGIDIILFSFIYVLFDYFLLICKKYIFGGNICLYDFFGPIIDLAKGTPFSHMWYVYMLIGVYISAPWVIALKNRIGEQRFRVFSILFLISAMFSEWSSLHTLSWDIGYQLSHLSYFIIGYTIFQTCKDKNKKNGYIYILVGVFFAIPIFVIRYYDIINYADKHGMYRINVPFSPLVVISSVFIFAGFCKLNIKKTFKLTKYSFYVYLIHPIFLTIFRKIVIEKVANRNINTLLFIVMLVISVYTLSLIISYIYSVVKKTKMFESIKNFIDIIFKKIIYKCINILSNFTKEE